MEEVFGVKPSASPTLQEKQSLLILPLYVFSTFVWCVILAHHLLSRLAVPSYHIMDRECQNNRSKCPSHSNKNLSGVYGETCIGIFKYILNQSIINV